MFNKNNIFELWAGLIENEEEYLYSSAVDYYGIRKGFLDLDYEWTNRH